MSPLGKRASSGQSTGDAPGAALGASLGAPIAIDPQAPSTLYLGAATDGIAKTVDGGKTWRPADAGIAASEVISTATDPRDEKVVYAGTYRGVFRSGDRGRTWQTLKLGVSVQAVAVDPANSARLLAGGSRGILISTEQGPHLVEGGRQHGEGQVSGDRVRPRPPGRRVRRRPGSRRDPKQRRWHHLAPGCTPPRLDRNDGRRPARIRDALRQLQRCASPQHRWGLLMEMALHSHGCTPGGTRNRSVRPADALRHDRRRLEQASPTASGNEHRWRQALAIPQVGHAFHRGHRSRHRARATRTRCTQRHGSRACCGRRTAEPRGDRSTPVSWRARSTRSLSTGPAATLYAGTNGAGVARVRLH